MRYAQTLDERGNFWRHGRWWWGAFHAEWKYWGRNWMAVLAIGYGDDNREVMLTLGTPLFSWYMSARLPRWLANRITAWRWSTVNSHVTGERFKVPEEREIGLRWRDGSLWWMVWANPMEWKSSDPWWRQGSFSPANFLLGRPKYHSQLLSEHRVLIPMPEKSYPASVDLREDSWKRPRWPFRSYIKRAQVTPDEGIPHNGKGENSWDCGDDATMGLTCGARTVEEAVGQMVECVYRNRRRYGAPQPEQAIEA